jgi:hypothetical protein
MGIRFRIADYRESVGSRISGLISTGNFTELVMKQRPWASVEALRCCKRKCWTSPFMQTGQM